MRRLRRKLRLGLAGIAFAAFALPPVAAAGVSVSGIDTSRYPTIRATVVSSAGPSIRPALTEDGTAVAGLEATNLAACKSVVLAIDRSQSMRGRSFTDAVTAARAFVAAKPACDRVAVVAFGSGVVGLSRFSSNGDLADSALAGLAVDRHEGTALYDAASYAMVELSHESGGRVLILLTDGKDTTSKHTLGGVVEAAQRGDVLAYPIAVAGPSYDPTALEEIAARSGGTFHRAGRSSALDAVYASIAAALRHTWRVSYLTSARPGDEIRLQAAAAGAGTGSAGAQIPSTLGNAQAATPSKLVPRSAYGPTGPLAVGLLVAALLFVALVLGVAAYRGSWVKSRIAAHVGETKGTPKQKRRERRTEMLSSLFRATERAFGHLKQWRAIQRMLERADVPLRTAELLWIMIAAGFGLALVAAVAGQPPLFILGALVVGGAVPFFVVWRKMRARLRAFEDQLADLLITIAASLKAGHSFKQGLQAVVDEGQPPASDEFKRVLTETSLGRPMDEALADMADRVGSKNFEFAITAVTIQRQVGGSLASLFDMVAETVRLRHQFARKIRSLTAMGRASTYVLVGVPFFLAGTISLIAPDYMAPLWHTSTGHLLIALCFVMIGIGSSVLKKIVSFRG
ncbi:MAG TPA: type II secretion system F family protein [Gaiellaceae bacterium]|nr:type II secretion system F family protein [Gaiellaceae bacterium]